MPTDSSLPAAWQMALLSLRRAQRDEQVIFSEVPAPRRMAPFALAVSGQTVRHNSVGDPVGSGRFVVLYDPQGQHVWNGEFRVVCLLSADIELELAADPLAPQVGWSWLGEALESTEAGFSSLVGAVSCEVTQSFSGHSPTESGGKIELRASWTPYSPDLSSHFLSWQRALLLAGGISPYDSVTHIKR